MIYSAFPSLWNSIHLTSRHSEARRNPSFICHHENENENTINNSIANNLIN